MSLKKQVAKGTVWSLMEKFSVQFVHFFVTLVLARLLTPDDYGVIALISVFISVAGVIADSGLGSALIQKKDVTDEDTNSVFYISLLMSSILYLVLFIGAPWVADFYRTPSLIPILRVLAVTLILNAVNSVQGAELSRKLLFHLRFRISLVATIVSSAVGVLLAYRGCGPWALVWSNVLGRFTSVIAYWLIIRWRPRWVFSWRALRRLFGYAWKLTVSHLLDNVYGNLYGFIIGRVYTKADLAFVNKGGQLPSLVMNSVNGSIGSVAFPALSKIQDDPEKMREAMKMMLTCSMFIVLPLMMGVAVCADRIVFVLFGSQWMPCVPYVQIACFSFALYPFHTVNLQAISATGRSGTFLMIEIVKKVVGIALVVATIRLGVFWMMIAYMAVDGVICVFINAWPNGRHLDYPALKQVRDVAPICLFAMIMGVVLLCVERILPGNGNTVCGSIFTLIVQFIAGVGVYGLLSVIFKPAPYRMLTSMRRTRK